MSHLQRLRCRELGLNCRHGTGARLQSAQSLPQSNWSTGFVKTLAKSSGYVGTWKETNDMRTGAIYGVEFSRDGKWLVACCSHNGILLVDPFNQKPVHFKEDAHAECVNCATIIDDYQFATGSDDRTIKIWDVRKLSDAVSQVDGFSNWVKSVQRYKEYVIGCSFREAVAYNMKTGQWGEIYNNGGLTRLAVGPKTDKLVMTSQVQELFTGLDAPERADNVATCLMVVHDLDIETMLKDVGGICTSDYENATSWLKPNPHHPAFSARLDPDHPRPKNKVEFINDFRFDCDQRTTPSFVTALVMHPDELCIVSRNVLLMTGGVGQYTSVHNISESNAPCQGPDVDTVVCLPYEDRPGGDDSDFDDYDSDLEEEEQEATAGFRDQFPLDEFNSRPNVPEDIRLAVSQWLLNRRNVNTRSTIFAFKPCPADDGEANLPPSPSIHCIPKNLQRLLFHAQEAPDPNMKYIKEPGFDPTGRFIASPYGDSIRLLGFDQDASSLDEIGAGEPHSLYQLNMEPLMALDSALVSNSKVSPQGSLVVASTYGKRINVDVIEGGSLNFFQPRF